MKKIGIRTETYETNYSGFMVDVVSDGKLYQAWIYHEEYGVKRYVVGCLKKDYTMEDFLEMVEASLASYIYDYKKENQAEEETALLSYIYK